MHHVCCCETCPCFSHSEGFYSIPARARQCQSDSEYKMQCKLICGSNLQLACLTWLANADYCRYSHLLLLQASCLPAPCHCLSMDYTLSACLHVALQLLLRLLAEQASLLDGHCGANEETAYFLHKTEFIWKAFWMKSFFLVKIKLCCQDNKSTCTWRWGEIKVLSLRLGGECVVQV